MKSQSESRAAATTPGQRPNDPSILVGVEYFNGWWKSTPNKWITAGKDWRSQYPDRIPLLGEYNSQETMDKEIDAASSHGVDFFTILWYYPDNLKDDIEGIRSCEFLNSGLEHFMQSPHARNMKFMLELCNHAPFAIVTDADWARCADLCVKAMKHPSYLRVDGRAALKIHSGYQFHVDNGGNVERSSQVLRILRDRALAGGAGELLITVGSYSYQDPIDKNHMFSKITGIDGTMQYMFVPDLPAKDTDYPYEELVNWAHKFRAVRRHDALNWVPYFPAGWNPRPWADPRPCFCLPTRAQWKEGLVELKKDLLASTTLGFPMKNGKTQKAFTIYAWNEFGEGGILAPTRGDQYMKLEVLREVFGK